MDDSPESMSEAPARFPPSVTVALLKDAAARAAYVRSEIAALKSKHMPLLSPGVSGSPGAFVDSASSGCSPATSYYSWVPAASEEWKTVKEYRSDTDRHSVEDVTRQAPTAQQPPSLNTAYAPERQQSSEPPSSSQDAQNSESDAPTTAVTARDHVMQRMKNVNAAMKEIERRKKLERKAAMNGAVHTLDAGELSSVRESRVRIQDLADGHHHTAKAHSAKGIQGRKPQSNHRASQGEYLSPPLPPPQSSHSPAAHMEVVVAESRISLANLELKAKPSRQIYARKARHNFKAPGKRSKSIRSVQASYGQAAMQRSGVDGRKVAKKKRAIREPPLDEVLGPWDHSKLDQSVGVLLASIDRKIAHEYHAVATVHQSRSPSPHTTSVSGGGSPSHEKRSKSLPSKSATSGEDCRQYTWQAPLVPNEAPMPPAVDPFFDRDPEELARELYPDSPFVEERSPVCAVAHWSPDNAAHARPAEAMGDEVIDVTVNQGTCDGSLSMPPLPSVESPTKMDRLSSSSGMAGSAPYATVSSLIGGVSGELSTLTLFEVMREVAVGTVMSKRKSQPEQGSHRSSFWVRSQHRGGDRKKGSTRKLQLILDAGRAVIAYRRGSLRGANHGFLQEVHTHSGSWESGSEIVVTTDTYTFHLAPLSARDYYVWILALNAALNFMTGSHLDFGASATDAPLHSNLHSIPPVMSLAQWASPGRSKYL